MAALKVGDQTFGVDEDMLRALSRLVGAAPLEGDRAFIEAVRRWRHALTDLGFEPALPVAPTVKGA